MICVILVAGHGQILEEEIKVSCATKLCCNAAIASTIAKQAVANSVLSGRPARLSYIIAHMHRNVLGTPSVLRKDRNFTFIS